MKGVGVSPLPDGSGFLDSPQVGDQFRVEQFPQRSH